MPLTAIQCQKALPTEKPYKLADSGGLYLLVKACGRKYWRWKYRIHGKEKLLALGIYPEVSLARAREKRDDAKVEFRNNKDPSAERQAQKRQARLNAATTFESVALDWHGRKVAGWNERHGQNILLRLKKDIFPTVGKRPIAEITRLELIAVIRRIEERGAGEMARRALQVCGQVFRYAVLHGLADVDITREMKDLLQRRKKGHYASIEVNELPALLKKLDSNQARLFPQTLLAMRLMLLTFVRTSELIEAKWSEIDFDNAMWVIPAERMKMGQQHLVPLSRQAIDVLRVLKEMNAKREYVFPSIPRPQRPMSNATILKGLQRIGYKNTMTGHGFRALAMGAIQEKLKYEHAVVDRQLAHKRRGVVNQAYDRSEMLEQRTEMMQAWADYIDKLQA